jgi:nucleoside-diphosphate-sugar epimerase
LRDGTTLPPFVEMDVIYNLASPPNSIRHEGDPGQASRANVLGAANVLGSAKRVNAPICRTFTREVYGDPLVHLRHSITGGMSTRLVLEPVMAKERGQPKPIFGTKTVITESTFGWL